MRGKGIFDIVKNNADMKIYKISQQQIDVYDFFELIQNHECNIINDFLKNKKTLIDWRVIPYERLKKIWQDYAKYGVVRDEKGLAMIVNMMIDNVARLNASTRLAEHEYVSLDDILEECGFNNVFADEKEKKDFYEHLDTKFDNPVTDYGLKPLNDLVIELINVDTDAEKIMIIDRMLQVTHMNGDLAALFVEGGIDALIDLFLN